jgi:two-component sensor histidine kinase
VHLARQNNIAMTFWAVSVPWSRRRIFAFGGRHESDLRLLCERLLAPYTANPDAVVIEPGKPVELGAGAVLSLSLVLHELATNAAKYGALSVSSGKVRVSWHVEDASLRVK